MRNVAIGAGVLYVCWSVYLTRVVVPPIAKHIEEDGTPIFFPFPFTSKVVESRPYKGTDPEWQEYIRIARDRDLLLKIRTDLLETVRIAAEANPILIQKCGRVMKVRKHWLDMDFPYRPPPKIMRDGLLLSHDGLEVVTMEVDPTTMMRISRALWPAPVAQSAPAFVSTLFRQNMQTVAKYFGYEVPEPTPANSLASLLKKRLEEAERRAASRDDPSDKGNRRTQPEANASGLPPAGGTVSSASASAGGEADPNKTMHAKDLIPFNSLRPSIENAWNEFKKKLSQTWLPLRPQPPSGCVGVSGLVELWAPNARVMIEVNAFWDPKTRKYDAQTMHMKLRSIRMRKQMPL